MDWPNPNGTILVYGTDYPLGRRLLYYLENYAKEAQKPLTIVAGTNPADMRNVQTEMWERYTAHNGTARPGLVINAHVNTHLARLENDPQWAFTVNTIPAANIALAARSAGIPMIQISTDHVFRGTSGPYEAEDEPHPINMLGVSMWYAEQAVVGFYPVQWRGSTIPRGASVIRLSELYGKEIENVPHMATAFPTQIQEVAHDLKFSPTFIAEAAFLIARNLIQSPQTLARQFIHLASPSEPISWHELLQPSGIKLTAKEYDPFQRAVRVGKNLGLKPTKGWVLASDFQKGMKEFYLESQQNSWIRYW